MAPATTKRRSPGTEELRKVRDRELELRRLSGDVSCADCRRLKLKCDKKIPCSSCVRRGADSLCPLGARGGSNQNSRRALLNTSSHFFERWKRKATLLSERVRALEDALAVESGARGGSRSHPLLAEELLEIKQTFSDDESDDDDDEEEEQANQLLGAFGTLSIDESRTMRYLGPASSESALLMEVLENSAPRLPISSLESGHLSRETIRSSRSFPFAPLFLDQSEESLLSQLISYLPPFERATALYEAFFRNLSWFAAPVERSCVVSEIVPIFYPRRKPALPGSIRADHAHDLALLFALFACGAAGDLTQSPSNDEAVQFHTLAKAGMGVKSIMHGASLTGVQTLYLLGAYDIYTGQKKSQEDAWKMVALGSCMAASIGLHRDPSRWGFDAKMIERRRRVFWEIYLIDTWRSLESGRPSTFRPAVVDCELPSDTFATIGEDGEVIESVGYWRYRFLRDIAADICEKVTSARPLRYRDVLELDRKIRDFPLHPFAVSHRPQDLGVDEEFRKIYPLVTAWNKEESLMYIHRNFFARAILDFPDNPMRSPFAASFLATYRSACNVIRICRENMHLMYLTILRVWHVWSLCLTSGVIAGAVASLGTSVSFATSAFVELEYTIALFEKFCDHKVAKHGLPLLRRIREKAIVALRYPRTHNPTNADTAGQRAIFPTIRKETDGAGEELLIFRGTTRIVERRSASSPADHNGSLLPGRDSLAGSESYAETVRKPDFIGNSLPPRNPLAAHNQRYTAPVVDFQNNRSVCEDTQSTGTFHVPQASSDTWLSELEGMFGPSAALQQPSVSNEQQAGGMPPASDWPADTYAQQPMPVPNNFYDLTNIPTFPYDGSAGTADSAPDDSAPDVVLNEAVSTEDWRRFMQQSGFSSTPPFDFVLDSFLSPGNSTAPDWQRDPTATTF
ncbi:hypothetical protein ACEPAF_7516 [Sanghuangporus sanghuang]